MKLEDGGGVARGRGGRLPSLGGPFAGHRDRVEAENQEYGGSGPTVVKSLVRSAGDPGVLRSEGRDGSADGPRGSGPADQLFADALGEGADVVVEGEVEAAGEAAGLDGLDSVVEAGEDSVVCDEVCSEGVSVEVEEAGDGDRLVDDEDFLLSVA